MRAKRAVIVGDPQQLRRVCFLGRAREHAAFVRAELTPEIQQRFSYRRSLFDVAANMADRRHFFFLDEHFRSHPKIIDFSNERFYDSALSIMTSRPHATDEAVISVTKVEGTRDLETGVNSTEVNAVLEAIREITDHAPGEPPSIGVVSPFRAQADAIQEALLREYSSEGRRRR